MKYATLFAILLTLSQQSASAQYRQIKAELQIDLDGDGDGKLDRVRVVDYGSVKDSLEFFYANGAAAQSFNQLLAGEKYSMKFDCSKDTSFEYCISQSYFHELKKLSEGSFEIIEQRNDNHSHNHGGKEITVSLRNGRLMVDSLHLFDQTSGGDVSHGSSENYDFVAGQAKKEEHSRENYDGGPFEHETEKALATDCQVSLSDLNSSGLPVCATMPDFQ